LERADLILAIQSEEAKYFEGLVETPISTVGYLVPPVVLVEEPHETSAKINIGYIGSGNPFNVTSILALHDFVSQYPCLLEKFEFSIAGTICSALKSKVPNFNLVGLVDELDDFYRVIDVVVNPMIGGTGLKIKSLEALSYGKPLIATKDAMVGISTTSDFQKFESVELLVSALRTFDNTAKEQLAIDSVNVFQAYNAQQIATFKKLFGNVE
jgi:glycosyltransferase involved in cell wall biosynthesis